VKTIDLQPKDFSGLSRFPGRSGNPFDVVLHRAESLQDIPWPVFGLILLALSLLPRFSLIGENLLLLAFFLGDWGLIAALPRAGRSFGPPKPPALVLAALRLLPALFFPQWWVFSLQILGTLLALYGFWLEPTHLHLTRQTLFSSKTSSNQPLKVLHVADLHVERVTARERKIAEIVAREHPDLILFSGDFLNLSYLQEAQAIRDVRALFSSWSAPLGIYAVTGSPAVDLPESVAAILRGLNVTRLDNQLVDIRFNTDTIHLIGVTCSHMPFKDALVVKSLLPIDDDCFYLLLYHTPDLAPEAARLGIDLQLSGHTHGGQVCLPLLGALFTGSLYGKTFESGRYRLGKMDLYVSRGIGMEGAAAPRVRLLCPPEVILWEIRSNQSAV
jgi:predicted MPP superfamily phosphohydrolase